MIGVKWNYSLSIKLILWKNRKVLSFSITDWHCQFDNNIWCTCSKTNCSLLWYVTVTNIVELSPKHVVSNIRHQHRCNIPETIRRKLLVSSVLKNTLVYKSAWPCKISTFIRGLYTYIEFTWWSSQDGKLKREP